MKILIVDDNEDIHRLLARRLRKQGCTVYSAVNGAEGVVLALSERPDIILMDMHMPVMDGYEATARLRKEGYRGVIAALTASAMSGDQSKAMKAGCDKFIPKPIGRDFEEQIRALVEKGESHA